MQLTQKYISNFSKDFFKGMDLSYGNFKSLYLFNFDFSGCNLTKSNLRYTNLYRANLSSAYLSCANLTGANLINCKINENTKGISDQLIKKFGIKVV